MVLALIAAASTLLRTTNIFVSPAGSDLGNGTRSHPFRTLEKARDAVRALRQAQPNLRGDVRVMLARGVYPISTAFRLTPEDSGTPISATRYIGDSAVVTGGRVLSHWSVDGRGWWHTQLPEVAAGHWNFCQLFVNGQRRYRPRFPKHGYSFISEELSPTPASKGKGFDRFGFTEGALNPSWHNLRDVDLLCFHIWDMSRMRIAEIDAASHAVTTTAPTGYDADWAKFPKGNRFIAENVREALSDPGEWYLDRPAGELTYIPMPGEEPSKTVVVAPVADHLLEIAGANSKHQYVSHVGFQGIRFEHSNWNAGPSGRFFPQAEVDLSAAVRAEGWRDGWLQDCAVSHTGDYGLELGGGCQNVTVSNCRLTDLGAGGVKIGETRLYDNESDGANHIEVSSCLIAHGGRLHPAAIGVWIGQSAFDTVQNCRIADFYYTGVSIGWTWGYGKSQAHDNLISGNEICDIGQGVLSDMGGIYTLGIEPNTRLVGNNIHDIDSFSYGGWGIYPDEGSSHEVIERNMVYRTKSGGFHQHYGEDNTVRNNLFAFAKEAEVIRTRAEDHLSFRFLGNVVVWKNAPLLGSNWSGNNYLLDQNVYWRTDGQPVTFAGMTLPQWQAKGQDLRSKIIDPRFVNAEKGDFRRRPDSPLNLLGYPDLSKQTYGPDRKVLSGDGSEPPAFPLAHNL